MRAWRETLASLLLAAAALLPMAPAAALNPQIRLQDYNHTMWTAKDGAPADIQTMAQTPDGWLWLGTSTGLYRFDGAHFSRYALPGGDEMRHSQIRSLYARPNGDLWIGYAVQGLSVLRKNGSFEDIPYDGAKLNLADNFAFDADGSLWMTSEVGLHRYAQGKWYSTGAREGLPANVAVLSMLIDPLGRFWINNQHGVYLLDRASGRFEPTAVRHGGGSLMQSPDGRIWLLDRDHVELLPAPPAGPRPANVNPIESHRNGLFDRDGNLWALHCPASICLVQAAGAKNDAVIAPSRQASDKLDQPWQLSSTQVDTVLEDREGNIWIATQAGLDRFRENRLIPAHIPVAFGMYTMAGDASGAVWAAEPVNSTAWRLDRHALVAETARFSNVATDRDGALLLAGPRSIERRYHGRVERIALPPVRDGRPVDQNVNGMLDDGKVLWIVTVQTGLSGLVDGHWLPRSRFNLPPNIYTIRPGGKGQLWLSVADGSVVLYDNGRQTRYDKPDIGTPTEMYAGSELVVAGGKGMVVLHGKQFLPIRAAEPEVLRNVSGIAVTADGDRWFNGAQGIVHVLKADWDAVVAHPQALLRYELIDVLDGYPGQAMLANRSRSIYLAPDGQLWCMTSRDIVHFDPRRLGRNPVAPQVQIERLLTGGGSYAAQTGLTLPAASSSFSIEFTAPSLSKPERVSFQYQLAGVDAGWQDAGARRAAYYTNVEPGSYRFRVRARNEDGVAGADTAELAVRIPPAFWQTLWFKLACGLTAAGLLYLLYLTRLRIVTGRVAERLHVRMAERERIARTLHDTILQSVQAITLRLHLVAQELPPDDRIRAKLDALLEQADLAHVEGRDQVHELRAGQAGDVEHAVADAGQHLALMYPTTAFSLQVSGAGRRLHSPVAEEACEIAREALRNAFRHAGAAKVEALLSYDADRFTLLIQDKGRGIDAARADGHAEHWGLVGMRERAARIGAKLAIDSKPGAGTRVTLTVPGRLAYAGQRRSRWWFFGKTE